MLKRSDMRILTACVLTLFAALLPAAATDASTPGFGCHLLAARQALPGSSTVDFRVVKMTFASAAAAAMHRHKYGEILYLLSGRGSSTIEGSAATALSQDRAIVIPPNVYHKLTPTGSSPLTVLSVQFPDRHSTSYDPRSKGADECKR